LAVDVFPGPSGAPVEVVSDPDAREWDDFVCASPEATGYHLWAWRGIFERAFGHTTEYLAARQGGRIVGVLPLVVFDSWLFGRFGVSLPFVNYGGVLAPDAEVADALREAAVGVAERRHLTHLELRHTSPRFPDLPVKQHKAAMRLPLRGGAEEAWQHLDRKVRNQVRKAERAGLVAEAGGAELVADFYRVFARNMRDLGTPVYTRRFFDQLVSSFPNRTRVWVVREGRVPVAASLTFGWRGTIEVPWASALRESRGSCANVLLYWTMIRDATSAGYRTFDFGRSTPGEGTYHFKRQWGAEPSLLAWEYCLKPGAGLPNHSPTNPRFHLAIAAWRWMPMWLTLILGPIIVRAIP
jgi:FemAB-related protein (PEP-CTERM system-associated)